MNNDDLTKELKAIRDQIDDMLRRLDEIDKPKPLFTKDEQKSRDDILRDYIIPEPIIITWVDNEKISDTLFKWSSLLNQQDMSKDCGYSMRVGPRKEEKKPEFRMIDSGDDEDDK